LDVIALRGHTPGSVALVYVPNGDEPTVIFSGDSLFPGGVGNTWNDAERFETLINDVADRGFAVYDDDTVVLPGHGGYTILGDERPHLDEWRQRGWYFGCRLATVIQFFVAHYENPPEWIQGDFLAIWSNIRPIGVKHFGLIACHKRARTPSLGGRTQS